MKHKHRLLSVLLSAVLVLSLLPAAFAEEGIAEDVPSAAPQSAAPAEAAPATQDTPDGVSAQANTEITTFDALKEAFTNGGDYTLGDDINTDAVLTVSAGVTVTLDLNGHTIDRGLAGKEAASNVITVQGSLTVKDSSGNGKITGGNTSYGGGVYVGGTGTFIMTGGSICDNRADINGGGITVYGNAQLLGGSITGNSGGFGSGVYVNSSGTLTVGGSISIQGNKQRNTSNNVQFNRDSTGKFVLSTTTPLTDSAKIGWTMTVGQTVPSDGVSIATGTNVAKYANAFTSDNGSYIFGLKAGEPDTLYCATSDSSTVKVPHTVTIIAGANMTKTSGEAVQEYVVGEMTPVEYTANDGYFFPKNYAATVTGTGDDFIITVSYRTVRISGTPTADVTLTLPDAGTAPTFNDGLGNQVADPETYVKGTTTHPTKGYTFDGWYNDADNTPLTDIDDAAAGTTYTARWRNSYGKLVRTTPLDLTQPPVLGDTAEGWKWDIDTKTLTLNNATFDVNAKERSGMDGTAAIILPDGAKIATQSGSKNVILNHSSVGSEDIVCGVMGAGALTINGSGELTIDAIDCGLFAMDSLTINAPITVNTDTDDGIAVLVVGAAPRITIPSSLYISTPTNGKVSVSSLDEGDKAASIVSGNDPAQNVVIRAVKYYYKTPGTTSTTTPAKSPKTADAGIALYAGMAAASLLGSGVVFARKRRNF